MTSTLHTAFDVAVIGLGYIGLPTAAVVARSGARVLGVDVSQHVVDTVAGGAIHIEEADLDTLVRDVVALGRLQTATVPQAADVFVIAVPTPFQGDHVPDITYVLSATRAIAPVLRVGDTVILESTSPVGTTEQIRNLLAELRPDLMLPDAARTRADVAVAYCPERVLPGQIILELVSNDRSIGGITPACAERARSFYTRFVEGKCSITTARTAEMVKLVENASRDVSIAFANELSLVCDRLGLDSWEVIRLANRHPRVNILQPGPGVGGHCIAVDPWFIVHAAPDVTPLMRTAREVNNGKPGYVAEQVARLLEAEPGRRAALLGLAFKANIDDLRESPAVKVALLLLERFGNRIDLVEPHVAELPATLAGAGGRLVLLETALVQDEVLVVLVDHNAFCMVPKARRVGKIVYDTRGIWRD